MSKGIKYIRNLTIQFLLGCTLKNWLILIWQNKNQKIYWKGVPRFLFITVVIVLLTPVRILEKLVFDWKVKKTKIKEAPVFVIGHWRSGTTYLVNMLSQDPQFGVTTAIHCFTPNIFLSCYKFLNWWLKIILPQKRHMDSVKLDTVSSQEEEFAIANMSTMSNYHMCFFPRNKGKYIKYSIFNGLTNKEIKKWKANYMYFIKKVTYHLKDKKRLLLKSPTNTSRIKQLLEMFPDAKFVHIARNPYKVYSSTKRLYNNFFPIFKLQKNLPKKDSEEMQFKIYEGMYKKYFIEKDLIPEGNLVEVKYEDIVKDPEGNIKMIYNKLNMSGYEKAADKINKYIAKISNYKPNKHIINGKLKVKIANRFAFTINKWGYDN